MKIFERKWGEMHIDTYKWKLQKMTPARALIGYYLLAVLVSVILLSLPWVHNPGVKVSFIDTLFTAVSGVSVTGLTVVNIKDTFSIFGQIILIVVLEIGGIGVMGVGTFFWLLFKKKIGLKERQLIMADNHQTSLSGVVNMIKEMLKIIFIIEGIGTILLGIHYLSYFPTIQEAFFQGLFAAVSATTNCGFDITGRSLLPFAHDYYVQIVHMILIISGAIGFPVLIEVKQFLLHLRKKKGYFRFSLFTKLTTITFFALLILGMIAILILEWNHAFKNMAWYESVIHALFQSISTRSGGLSTIDISQFSEATLLIMSALMFIGASPNSVGGGIRTTTFALNILFVYHFAKGDKDIKVFGREIHEDDLFKSLAVSLMAVFLCFFSLFILSITEDFSIEKLFVEICSAFGTTGFSAGITPHLSNIGKCTIMFLMFIGRIGLVSFMFSIGGKEQKLKIHYPKERVMIG